MKEFKSIGIRINYQQTSKNVEVTVDRKAEMDFGTETTFSQVEGFLKDFHKVIQSYKHCVKNGIFCKVYLSSAVYEMPGDAGTLHSRSFNGWQYEGVPMDGDAEGLYLSPDTRYTNEEHDIYIDLSKPLLSQLAEAHI